jgi:hypothetical protein
MILHITVRTILRLLWRRSLRWCVGFSSFMCPHICEQHRPVHQFFRKHGLKCRLAFLGLLSCVYPIFYGLWGAFNYIVSTFTTFHHALYREAARFRSHTLPPTFRSERRILRHVDNAALLHNNRVFGCPMLPHTL